MFPDPRLRRLSFEYPGSAGAGPQHQCVKVKSEREVSQSCLTPSDPMDCSLPGSSVHGIFQARVLEWGAIASSDSVVYGDLNGKEIQKRGDICTHIAGSFFCAAETNTTLSSSYAPVKLNLKNK